MDNAGDDDRASGGEAEEVLMIGGNGIGGAHPIAASPVKEIIRVQIVVAHVLPGVAMESVGAGFEGRIDDAAGGVAEFGVEVAALEREFLDGIWWRDDGGVGPGIVATIDLDI